MCDEHSEKQPLHVAQPPSAVGPSGSHRCVSRAPAPREYQRNLPHIQGNGGPLYITFCTERRWVLPPVVRSVVLEHCLHDHGTKMLLYCAVVMPDHVHLIYAPMLDDRGVPYPLHEILGPLKGASAYSVNRRLGRRGTVWQDESMDHVLRSDESLEEKIAYVRHNPLRAGLARSPEEYRWLWVNEDVYVSD